ncbi:hypothetical protein [Streptacidiphilus sp. PAMC 29251]
MTTAGAAPLRVPVGVDAARWSTRGGLTTVLLVVHNVTSATRLLDVVPLFRDDLRIQLLATCTGSSPFQAGISELFARLALPVLPWEQALETSVDLALSASLGGQIHEIPGKLAVLSHGVGYNKRLATANSQQPTANSQQPTANSQQPTANSQQPTANSQQPTANSREPVFGLSEPWLVVDGELVPDAMVLSHPEQFERLAQACVQALPTAVLGGDPCFDRILAARPLRERYRRALGVREGQRLVVLNSTWNPQSLFGDEGGDILPLLLEQIIAELPLDEFRVTAVLHPNIWHGHGAGQIRTWLDRARRAGLTLIDPLDSWRQALVAADVVLGDFGSVSYMAAALGTPVLLGVNDTSSVLDPDSPVGRFVQEAPRLDPFALLRPQLEQLLDSHVPMPGPAEFTTSVPGRAGELLRRIFYDLAELPEPEGPALLDPLPLPAYESAQVSAPLRVFTHRLDLGDVELHRYPDLAKPPAVEGAVHTAVNEDTLDPGRLELADLIYRVGEANDPRFGSPQLWAAETLSRFPHCAMAVFATTTDSCAVVTAAGVLLQLSAPYGSVDPVAAASALFACLAAGDDVSALCANGLTVRTGAFRHAVAVRPVQGGRPHAGR